MSRRRLHCNTSTCTFPQAYPPSARNLNRLTKMVDVDIYDADTEKMIIDGMEIPIKITVGRMKDKDTHGNILEMPGNI